MPSDSPADDAQDLLRLELYKSLRQEAGSYVEKVPGVWLQKFIFAGAVIAFVVQNREDLSQTTPNGANSFVVLAFACVPVLAMLLDVKILEYGLHARAISRFIEQEFQSHAAVAAWEASLWGGGVSQVAKLTRWRSFATVAVTIVPTAVLILVAAVVVGRLTNNMPTMLLVAIVFDLVYLAIGVMSCIAIWPQTFRRRS